MQDRGTQRKRRHSGKLIEAIVIGTSAGGFKALPEVIAPLPSNLPAAVVVVQHVGAEHDQRYYMKTLSRKTALKVNEALEREPVLPGHLYVAPANYHVLVEADKRFALSVDDKVHYSRPSIDVLFQSAARAYGRALVGVVLSGASADGAQGLSSIKSHGGWTVVQDPRDAESDLMPQAAIQRCRPHAVLGLNRIGPWLTETVQQGGSS